MARTLVSVSWTASHWKGGDPGGGGWRMDAQQHTEWLEEAVLYYRARSWDVIVAATDWRGIIDQENAPGNCGRDILWRLISARIPIVGTVANPGHQVGAALCIRLGLEYAAHCGYDYLIHTAEDILPGTGWLDTLVAGLDSGADYAGELWGSEDQYLNAQMFACRVAALVGPWDACQVGGYGHIENYLAHVVGDRPKALYRNYYRTTHDRADWKRCLIEQEHQEMDGG